jgi:predicted RNA-binding protein
MSYWIYVTNSDNWAVTKKTNILGASARYKNALSRVKKGDKCLIYVKSEKTQAVTTNSRIVGVYEVVSDVFRDSQRIFQSPRYTPEENYEYRVELKPLSILDAPVEFTPLVAKLSFIKNKAAWALSLKGRAVIEIPKADYDLVLRN